MIKIEFNTLIVCTILCALTENSLSYAVIDDDYLDGSDGFEIELIGLDNDKNNHADNDGGTKNYYHAYKGALTDKYRYDHDSNNDHQDTDFYFEEAHQDNDKDYHYKHYHDNHHHFHKVDRDENIPDIDVRSGFDYKKRSVSGSRQLRSNYGRESHLKRVRHMGGQPTSSDDDVEKISGSRLPPIKHTNKRRVVSFRGGQPISGPTLRPGLQIKEKRAMKKL